MNIRYRFHIKILFVIIFFLSAKFSFAQDSVLNKYGLWIIKSVNILHSTVISNADKQMIDLKKLIPNISFDLKYATDDNFMHQTLYPHITTTYLRWPAVKALQLIQRELNAKGLSLKIFDAYRPYAVTEKMWEPIKDERYVADPKKGSGHNRGIAVDLTIINLKTKKELTMGTGFDNFSDTAHQSFTALPEEVLQNKILLKTIMEKYGFTPLDTEWWHYSLPNAKNFELLDIPFKALKKYTKKIHSGSFSTYLSH